MQTLNTFAKLLIRLDLSKQAAGGLLEHLVGNVNKIW